MPAPLAVPVRTASSRIAARAQQACEQAGLPPQAFARRTGITPGEWADPMARIDADRHRRLLSLVLDTGLRYPWESMDPSWLHTQFPVLGNLCLNAPTLRDALAWFGACRPLIGGFDYLSMRQCDGLVRLEYLSEFVPADSIQAMAHFQALAGLVRAYDAGAPTRFDVELIGAESPALRGIAAFFGARVRYGGPANRMQFATAALDQPFAHCNPCLLPQLRQQARDALAQVREAQALSARIERLVREQIAGPHEAAGGAQLFRQVCERLAMSRWTLYRRLQDEGQTYREIELRVRLAESRRLLGETRSSVAEISERMGFASQSAFTRFFRAQQGLAPLAFRRQRERQAWPAA